MLQRKWQEDALCLWHRMAVGASRTSGPSDRCSRSQACQWLRVHGGAVARSGGPECGSCASRSSVGAPLPAPAAESRPAVWRLRIDRGPFSVGGCRGERPAARIAEGTGPRGSATAVHQTGAVHALNLVGSRPRPIHVTGTQTRGPCSVLTGNWASCYRTCVLPEEKYGICHNVPLYCDGTQTKAMHAGPLLAELVEKQRLRPQIWSPRGQLSSCKCKHDEPWTPVGL